MAYTLTQARPLLSAAELELFAQSRTEPVKQLTPAKLAGAVKRTRTLRDKYRDLYQRQTVAVRTSTPGAVTGDDNQRTQRKADILQEVLERYEARATLLHEQGSSKAAAKKVAKGTTANGKAAAKAGTDQGSSVKKKKAGSADPQNTIKGAVAVPAVKASAKASKAPEGASTDKASQQPSKPAGSAKKSPVSAQLNTLAGAGVSAAAVEDAAPRSNKKAGSAPARSPKAPSRKAPTAGSKAAAPDINAPLDTVPSAKRGSPLKQNPANIAVQAHQSSRGRRTQGKRDSR